MSSTLAKEGSVTMVTTSSHLPLLGYSEEERQQQILSSTSPLTNNPSMIQELMELHCSERQSPPDYLVLLHIASFGKQGSGLGSDESHVSMLTAKIFDIQEHTVNGAEWQTPVRMPDPNSRPYSPDESGESITISNREEMGVSEECYAFTGLQLSDVTKAPPLWEALETMDNWIITHGLFYSTNGTKESNFELAVDGGTGLRLVLHQSLDHPIEKTYRRFPYLCQFIDIKKAFMLLYWKTDSSFTMIDMLQSLNLRIPDYPPNFSPEAATWVPSTVNQIMATNSMPNACHSFGRKTMSEYPQFGYWPLVYCRTMANLCERMTSDGAQWKTFEKVNLFCQPKFVRSTDNVPDDVVVRARGLPWQATNIEVKHFFRGLNIAPGGIALVLSKAGRRNGEAVIRFTTREQRDLALKKHKHHMNQRYIEIYAANSVEFIAVAGGETQEAETYLNKFTSSCQSLIRMRGLPYTVSTEEIIDFFAKTGCQVQFDREGILFVNRKDGRATGDAFVMFATDAEAEKALKNHRQHIGNRYIELFRSTPAEVNQVMNAVLKQAIDILPSLWPTTFDPDKYLSQSGPLLDLQSPTMFSSASKGSLFIPNPNFTLPMLNMPPMTLTVPNTLGNLLPGSSPNSPLLSSGHLLRIKGMPPGTTVNDILNFLGSYWQAVALHGIHLIYTATGEASGEAFVRFISQQVVQMVLTDKQGHPITNAATGVQANVQLSPATLADMVDFISIPGTQSSINWSTVGTANAAAAAAAFVAQVNPYPHLFAAAASGAASPLHTHLFMQMRAVAPFATNTSPLSVLPTPAAGLTITAAQSPSSIKTDADILCQTGVRAGSLT
ncbi:unnamed protein product [Hymenolepis diminuta]|uniref:RRM domain-containing protein n=1 Tax=Hymenolepis diminuta TaxID=6216 RepID=A0A564Y9A3_HYMDI|nr:unnamed protein product [Hymenolepis diminuta]